MSLEMMWNEDEANNTSNMFNRIIFSLQNIENSLDGIDSKASKIGVTLNTSQIKADIDDCNNKIENIIRSILAYLNILEYTEEKNVDIANAIMSLDLLGKGFEIKNTGSKFELWKDGVEYDIKIGSIPGYNGDIKYKFFILDPKGADKNIPTAFFLDGDGPSAASELKDDAAVVSTITSLSGAYENYGEYGDRGGYNKIPLTGINYGGLQKPNVRFIYMPNNGTRWHSTGTSEFDKIVDYIVENYDIDQNNMTLIGHSARRVSCSKIRK